MTEGAGVWVYAITEDRPGAALPGLTGVAGAGVRAAPAGGLTALVSDVDLAEYGEAALRRNMEDLDWLAEVARAHHRVVDAAASTFPLLPTRLATVYRTDAAMSAALSARDSELRAALRRVGGRTELGVKAYARPQPASPAGDDDDAASEHPDAQRSQGEGLAYLQRRRAQKAAARDTGDVTTASAQALHADLSARALLTRLHPPQAPQLSGVREPMLLNAAYLVDTGCASDFAEAVAVTASAHPQLRVELTGPWPPYSFVSPDDGPPTEGGP
jgi:Gas vesicle synthesis protein GvpL/GvpF